MTLDSPEPSPSPSWTDLPIPPPSRNGWPWTYGETELRNGTSPPPRITVVTPSFNQGDFLEETIRSVLMQGYPNLQYIVVDGGSTDQSREILDRYRDQISTVICEPDDGQSDAICKGIRIADGKYFNWINSDDVLMPGTLWQVAKCDRDDVDLVTFSIEVFGDQAASYLMHNRNLSAKSILRADPYSFSQPGLWFRTQTLHDCGGIDLTLNYGFDWDLLIRYLAIAPEVVYSDHVGGRFRLHDQSKTVVEFARTDETANQFLRESSRIRDKLEAMLSAELAAASRLGRAREPWNKRLDAVLDDLDSSPGGSAWQILCDVAEQPRVRCSGRSFGAIARLLSRYVRAKSSIGARNNPS